MTTTQQTKCDVFNLLVSDCQMADYAEFYVEAGYIKAEDLEHLKELASLPIVSEIKRYSYQIADSTVSSAIIQDYLEELALNSHCTFKEAKEIWSLLE